jgi:hypothetical protein
VELAVAGVVLVWPMGVLGEVVPQVEQVVVLVELMAVVEVTV